MIITNQNNKHSICSLDEMYIYILYILLHQYPAYHLTCFTFTKTDIVIIDLDRLPSDVIVMVLYNRTKDKTSSVW